MADIVFLLLKTVQNEEKSNVNMMTETVDQCVYTYFDG